MSAATVAAAVTSSTATDIANAIKSGSTNVTGASFVTASGAEANGTGDAALGGFPTGGPTFGILTTGLVASVDDPETFANASNGGGNVRGNTDRDVTILRVDLMVPTGANCLTFDFKFLTEEFDDFVGGTFNDAFVAELDASSWMTAGSTISAPGNFAFDDDDNVVSVNSTGIGGLSAAEGAGTAFDGGDGGVNHGGATMLLQASTEVTSGTHSVYFSIFDQGDDAYDSAVFLDNLVVGFVPNPASNCKPGAAPVTEVLALTPASATNPTGTPHTVTATLTDPDGAPIEGRSIAFTVGGVNSGSGTGTTDASGHATFTYTGTNVGQDQINACTVGEVTCDGSASASATKDWTTPATQCPPTQTCTSDPITSSSGQTSASVTAGPGATITASFSTLAQANYTACGGIEPRDASGVLTFDATGSNLPKLLKLVVANTKPFKVCWNAPTRFRVAGGGWSAADPIAGAGFTGILPNCVSTKPTMPCVLPVIVKKTAPTANVYILAPAGDPKAFISRG
jgi:hypothetical protein